MTFQDRMSAGIQLGKELSMYAGTSALLLAISLGGAAVGYGTALETGLPLQLQPVKKIGHPRNRGIAIGAVSLDDSFIQPNAGISRGYIELETVQIRKRLANMKARLNGSARDIDIGGRTVIIVDDGLSTGNTMLCAIRSARKKGAARIVVAVPVAPDSALTKVKKAADRVIVLAISDVHAELSEFYADFHYVHDEEAVHYLNKGRYAVGSTLLQVQ